MLSENAIFDQWNVTAVDIRTMQDMHPVTFNQSYLRYLHFAHQVTTGARFYTVLPQAESFLDYTSIIAACLYEAFDLGNIEDEACDMKSYTFRRT